MDPAKSSWLHFTECISYIISPPETCLHLHPRHPNTALQQIGIKKCFQIRSVKRMLPKHTHTQKNLQIYNGLPASQFNP